MNGNSSSRLLSYVERLEHLAEEMAELRDLVKSVKQEAKSAGFDPKVISQMLKERAMGEAERQEWMALLETYRAALGMLDGTPLGDATRKRLLPKPPASAAASPDDAPPPVEPEPAQDHLATLPPATPETIEAARAEGRAAQINGAKITANPYPAGDPRRAAWDESWCAAAASDGMDIPDAWRRKPKKPKGDGAEKNGGAA